MPPEDPFAGLPKTFAEEYFWSLDVEDRGPLPNELRFLKLFAEGAVPRLRELVLETLRVTEKRVPDTALWDHLNGALRELKLAQEWAVRRIDYFERR